MMLALLGLCNIVQASQVIFVSQLREHTLCAFLSLINVHSPIRPVPEFQDP